MEIIKEKQKKLYELILDQSLPRIRIKGAVISKERVLVGHSESCDVVIPLEGIAAVHAVLEILPQGRARIYDMNSVQGTFVNGSKVVVGELKLGDCITFGNIKFSFKEYVEDDLPPPILEGLSPIEGNAFKTFDEKIIEKPVLEEELKTVPPKAPELPKAPPVEKSKEEKLLVQSSGRMLPKAPKELAAESLPRVVYPLASDPKAEFSEYIFEDADQVHPIFDYTVKHTSLEVVMLFNDTIFSVDYIPAKKGVYKLVGTNPKATDIEYPYLAKKDRFAFIEVLPNGVSVNRPEGFETLHLTSEKNQVQQQQGMGPLRIDLGPQDIVRFINGNLQIFVRHVESPPYVESASLIQLDKDLRKNIFLVLLSIFVVLLGLNFFEVDPEKEKEQAPDRIATILYQKKLKPVKEKKVALKEPAKPQQEAQVKPEPKQEAEPQPKKEEVKKPVEKRVKRRVPPKQRTTTRPQPKPPAKRTSTEKGGKVNKVAVSPNSRKAIVVKQTMGHVDTYKAVNFQSSLSSVLAKSSSMSNFKVANTVSHSGFTGTVTGGVTDSAIKRAQVDTNVGSLQGAVDGKLSATEGAEGIIAKSSIMTAGVPSETVVLGSMDPDLIRAILREHIPQFRYCYQKELDAGARSVSGLVRLNFVIGASGHVQNAGVESSLPSPVKACVVSVLRGIKFPEPAGGGTVEVRQPINFYPKRM